MVHPEQPRSGQGGKLIFFGHHDPAILLASALHEVVPNIAEPLDGRHFHVAVRKFLGHGFQADLGPALGGFLQGRLAILHFESQCVGALAVLREVGPELRGAVGFADGDIHLVLPQVHHSAPGATVRRDPGEAHPAVQRLQLLDGACDLDMIQPHDAQRIAGFLGFYRRHGKSRSGHGAS